MCCLAACVKLLKALATFVKQKQPFVFHSTVFKNQKYPFMQVLLLFNPFKKLTVLICCFWYVIIILQTNSGWEINNQITIDKKK